MIDLIKNGTGEILQIFFQDSEKEYYLREIAVKLKKEPGYFKNYMDKLVKEGILHDERRANLRYFRLNKKYFLYDELKSIISKTIGVQAKLKKIIDKLKEIEYAFIFGSFAKNKENSMSDIDLMLIGKTDQDYLVKKINKAEDELGREINYHIYDKLEVIKKLKNKNDFIVRIFNEPKIILKGKLDEFTRFN